MVSSKVLARRVATSALIAVLGLTAACSNKSESVNTADDALNSASAAQEAATLAKIKENFKNAPTPTGKIPVVWRIDDIQAWFCSSILSDIFAVFTGTDTPLSIGIIGRDLDQDTNVDTTLKGLAGNANIELADHSFSHPDGGLPSLGGESAQQADLSSAQAMITKITNVVATTFIAPDNAYDADTLTAMSAEKLNVLSAQCTWSAPGQTEFCPTGSNVVWPNITTGGITYLPAGAVIDSWTDFTQPASVDTAMTWANSQAVNQGFVVFMLHPQELATDSNCTTVDQTKLAVIKQLIDNASTNKWEFYTFQQLTAQAAKARATAAKSTKQPSVN